MTNQERIDQYNERVALLTEYGLPVNETLIIDDVGNFNLVEEVFTKYKGRVVGDGVIYCSIYDNPQDYMPIDMDLYLADRHGRIVAHNIDGIDFVGYKSNRYGGAKKFKDEIESIYGKCNQIFDEIKKGTSDEEIAEKFGLESFKHEKSKKKSMQ